MRIIKCASGSPQDLIDAVNDKIVELGGDVVTSGCNTTDVPASQIDEEKDTITAAGRGWQYYVPDDLAVGLRSALQSGDFAASKSALLAILDWMKSEPELYDQFDFDIDDIYENVEMIDPEYDDVDEFDYELNDFYDFCDNVRIWVPIDSGAL